MVDLKLVTGGGTGSGNWLVDLPLGTVFEVCSKTDRMNFMTMKLQKIMDGKSIRLWDMSNDRPFGDVVPNRFVNMFELFDNHGVKEI